jgi:hypothetical protein
MEASKCGTSAAPEDFVIFANALRLALVLVAGARFELTTFRL